MEIKKYRIYRLKSDIPVTINDYSFKPNVDYTICAISLYDVYFYNVFYPINNVWIEKYFDLSPIEQRKDKLKKLKCLK